MLLLNMFNFFFYYAIEYVNYISEENKIINLRHFKKIRLLISDVETLREWDLPRLFVKAGLISNNSTLST